MSSNENFLSSMINNEALINLNCKLLFRLISLIFNGLIIRNVNLNLIGIGNIRLELFYSTILFLSRESLRRNVPKLNNIHSIYHYINLIWLIIPFGFIFLFLTLFLQTNHNEKLFPYYNEACFMYGLAAFIELLSEPLYLLATVTRNYRINIYIQFFASIIGFGLQTLLIIRNPDSALFCYGFGCIIYSILITSVYYSYFLLQQNENRHRLFLIKSLKDLLIKPTSPFVDHKLLSKTFESFQNVISMRILTEGQKYLITIFCLISFEEQGIYHIIYLLGSIFPRLIFPTIEQISSNYFQETLSRTKSNFDIIEKNQFIQDDQMLTKPRKEDQTFVTNTQQSPRPNEEQTIKLNALTLLNKLVRLLIIISLLLMIFVIPHSSTIINNYVGINSSIKCSLIFYLRLYLFQIFLNGINIINESFVQSIMSIQQLKTYQNFILFYSFVYLIVSYIFIQLFGITGIIIVNCLNIFGRILINNLLINRYLIQIKWFKSYLLSSHYIFFLLISFLIFYFNQILIENHIGQFIFAIGFILIIICFTFLEEKEMIHYIYCVSRLNYQNQKSKHLKRN